MRFVAHIQSNPTNVQCNDGMSYFSQWLGAVVYLLSHWLVRTTLLGFLALVLIRGSVVHANEFHLGVYYFPGWKDNQEGAPSPLPWERIKGFPEREPMLGWYDEGADDVMRKHLDWMQAYGIDYVVFDWYFVEGRKVVLEHALAAYMRAPNRARTKFTILWANHLWANHNGMPKSMLDWQTMVSYWVKYYFPRPEFLRIDGRPVIYIFSADNLRKQAEQFGTTAKVLLDSAQLIAQSGGYAGIYFVAGTGAYSVIIDSYAKQSGYSAFSIYNFHIGPQAPLNTPSHSFKELDQRYQAHWQRFAERGSLPLIVPMTSGWDRRPWGGSKDPAHDNSLSTLEEFGSHLEAAKAFMNANPNLTRRMGVICCWNEFGEGSFIEPTKKDGFGYLEKVRKVFGKP